MKNGTTPAEHGGHAVLKVTLAGGMVAAEAASVVDQFTVIGVVVPFWTKRLNKGGIHFSRQAIE